MSNKTVTLAFVSDETSHPDPARAEEVGRDVSRRLQSQGYAIQPTATGMRGGGIYDVFMQVAQTIQDNHALLQALAELAISTATLLIMARKERTDQQQEEPQPLPPIVIAIDNRRIEPTAADMESSQALLARLLKEDLPATMTPQSTIAVTARVPPESSRDL
jgi:hypothetical protein